MDAVPQSLIQEHLQIQALADGYQRLLRENAILLAQMVAMGYAMPHGYELDPTTGRIKVTQTPRDVVLTQGLQPLGAALNG